MMKKVIAYCRVSTEEQASSGVSLHAQEAKLRALAFAQDVELSEVIVDAGISAKSLDRQGIQQILQLVRAGVVDRVYVTKLDRLTRNIRDLADLVELFQKRGVALVSAAESLDTSSAGGRLVLNVLGCIGQWEREIIGERTAEALRHKKATHKAFNHCPYGYRREGDCLLPIPEEQATITRIRSLRDENLSLRQIARTLNHEGVFTKKGKQWQAQSVADVLRLNPVSTAA